jgi:hypothetical protein
LTRFAVWSAAVIDDSGGEGEGGLENEERFGAEAGDDHGMNVLFAMSGRAPKP